MTSFWLEFQQGGQLQKASFESDSISLGRDRSSDFVLDHPTVSRQHALIVHEGQGRFELVVLSRGGLTAVEGEPVQSSQVELYDGTEVTLGKYTVRFRSRQAASKPARSPAMADGSAGMGQQGGGGFGGDSSMGGGQQPGLDGGGEQPAPEDEGGDQAGIMSWDEIAASPEAQDGGDEAAKEAEPTDFERLQRAKKEDDKSNPAVLIGGAILAAVFLAVAFFGGSSGDSDTVQEEAVPFHEQTPVEVSVDCVDPTTCKREAEQNYERALDLLEEQAVETQNLFEGYHRLLLVEAYLEEAGEDKIPDEMDEWQEKHDTARQELDANFRDLRMRYHQAKQRPGSGQEMADVLAEIEAYFPERTARENRWARDRESEMKSEGIYPRD